MVTLEDTLSPLLGDLVEDVVGTPMAMVHSFLLSDSLLVGGWLGARWHLLSTGNWQLVAAEMSNSYPNQEEIGLVPLRRQIRLRVNITITIIIIGYEVYEEARKTHLRVSMLLPCLFRLPSTRLSHVLIADKARGG